MLLQMGMILLLFQSTPSLRKVTPRLKASYHDLKISIHTFLAEGDQQRFPCLSAGQQFQSTPSLRKVTPMAAFICYLVGFQSTPSLRKVTKILLILYQSHQFQSTPSLRKVTSSNLQKRSLFKFQSTPSLRKVTLYGY